MMPDSFRPEPRCHVCRTDAVREMVNGLLANGSSYAQIVRAVVGDGVGELSLDSVRNHANRHFPVQNAAQATYREILERRAAENRIDFEAGVANVLTPLAFYETLMVKSYQRLVHDDTEVSIEAGLRAAEKLQGVIGAGDAGAEILQMRVQVGRIIEAMKSTVPEPMWAEITAKLKEPGPGSIDVPRSESTYQRGPFVPGDDDDDDDKPFDPGEDGDDDDF